MATEVTRKLKFDAMHRLTNHEGKCRAYHGHEYRVEITCTAAQLDSVGRVIDFSVIKREVGGWIDTHWDHSAIFNRADDSPATLAVIEANKAMGQPCYLMDGNPTAENIAKELMVVATRLLAEYGIRVTRIVVHETQNCYATETAE